MSKQQKSDAYPYASGGWGSLKAVARILLQEKALLKDSQVLMHQNKPDGFMCVSCSWAKPADPHTFEFCESGAKATAWDLTAKRVTPDFFEVHTVSELAKWHDHDDRFRGIKGSRMVILMNPADMAKRGRAQGARIALETIADDGVERRVDGLTVVPFDVPQGCIGGYYPECNPLLPLWHYAKESKVPGAKSIPVRVSAGTR
ncbi:MULTISPECIES: hypothetical protein [Paraburkholderia]|uniref:Formate dehydrogenase n=1 Tax=Paraburkholderia podalyriae TaxID=1938811 RepID=A0ABR7PMI9_9BURK|nr:hypothetical protein [Paraburkholderia podalyriae]